MHVANIASPIHQNVLQQYAHGKYTEVLEPQMQQFNRKRVVALSIHQPSDRNFAIFDKACPASINASPCSRVLRTICLYRVK